jgi:hypothetical protein
MRDRKEHVGMVVAVLGLAGVLWEITQLEPFFPLFLLALLTLFGGVALVVEARDNRRLRELHEDDAARNFYIATSRGRVDRIPREDEAA